MGQNKVKIGISIDPALLASIDEVCEAKEAKRSTIIERMLAERIEAEREAIAVMEQPFYRFLARRPSLIRILATLSNEEVTDEEIELFGLAADKGEARQLAKRVSKKGVTT